MLESALEQAFAGQGQVIGIVGEAGVGKSRLCHEFAEHRRAKAHPSTTSPARRTQSPYRSCLCSSSCALTSRSPKATPSGRRASGSPASLCCSMRASH